MIKRIISFFSSLFINKKLDHLQKEVETFSQSKSVMDLTKKLLKNKSKKLKRCGRLIYNASQGSFIRQGRKLGRNDICPCGRMREFPRDESKPMKYKFCCGRNPL